MSLIVVAFLQVVPVFLVVVLGFFLRRLDLFDEGFTKKLSRFVYYVTIPPLMFQWIAKTDLAFSFDPKLIGTCLIVVSLLAIFTFLGASMRVPPSRRGVITQGVCRSNLVFVGLAIFVNLHGEALLAKAAVFIAFQALGINVLSVVFLLLPYHSLTQSQSWVRLGKEVVMNPVIVGSALGMVWSAMQWNLPAPLDQTLDWIAQTALPLALLTVGASLELSTLQGQGLHLWVTSALKLILLPAVILAVLYRIGIRGDSLAMAVLLLSSPTAVVSHILAKEMKGDADLASSIVMVTTVLSPLTMTLWVVLLRTISGTPN